MIFKFYKQKYLEKRMFKIECGPVHKTDIGMIPYQLY